MNTEDAFYAVRKAIEGRDSIKAIRTLEECPGCLNVALPCGGTWLNEAASSGMVNLALWLIKSGVDVNVVDDMGYSPIQQAALCGHPDLVKVLSHANATIDVSSPDSNPLLSAIFEGHLNVVQALVELGIDYRKRYTRGSMVNMDALGYAIERGQTEIADYLRSLGMTDPSSPSRKSA